MKDPRKQWIVIPGSRDEASGLEFGPWRIINGRGMTVANCGDGCSSPDTAKLISAAPDMAELLVEMQWASGGGFGPSADDQEYEGVSCFICKGMIAVRSGVGPGHEKDCRLVAVLRKAGIAC